MIEKNPRKRLAMLLAHQMDDESTMYDENHPQWKIEEIRNCGNGLRDEILKSGFDIHELLLLGHEYKQLSITEYGEWIRA